VQGPFVARAGEGAKVLGPALGLIETASVARGIVVADAMVKKAPVELVRAQPISSGKYVIMVSGQVADVEEAMAEAQALAATTLVDRLLLPQPAESLLGALAKKAVAPKADEAVGIFETQSVASTVFASDAACKAAAVQLVEIRLGDGLGGKAFFVLAGEHGDVEAALYAAEHATPTERVVGREIIPRPHQDLLRHLG
jgi:microcompartment protein CcmL/EutN